MYVGCSGKTEDSMLGICLFSGNLEQVQVQDRNGAKCFLAEVGSRNKVKFPVHRHNEYLGTINSNYTYLVIYTMYTCIDFYRVFHNYVQIYVNI